MISIIIVVIIVVMIIVVVIMIIVMMIVIIITIIMMIIVIIIVVIVIPPAGSAPSAGALPLAWPTWMFYGESAGLRISSRAISELPASGGGASPKGREYLPRSRPPQNPDSHLGL